MDPVQPVEVGQFMVAVIAGALVVMCGALYAILYAFGRLWSRRSLLWGAYLAFAVLAGCVLLLSGALNLDGTWQIVTAALLVGYFLAPRGVWRLCVGTHPERATEPQPLAGGPDR